MSPSLNQLSRNRAGVDGVSRPFASDWRSPASAMAAGTIQEDTNVFKCSFQFHKRDAKGAPLPTKSGEWFISKSLFMEQLCFTSMRLFGFFLPMERDSRERTRGPEEIKRPSPLGQNLVYDVVSSRKVLILKKKKRLMRQRSSRKDKYQWRNSTGGDMGVMEGLADLGKVCPQPGWGMAKNKAVGRRAAWERRWRRLESKSGMRSWRAFHSDTNILVLVCSQHCEEES